ncbi:MAG TPA: CPBP family intramembrane metalloprotease [Kiritimatiellia bacterium]|nr:CPBP family intramembrane metalloprotease [Kiritimatiellia bacterium]HPS06201.1 CPBP family intramembrane metalloprotease [Kiritimatiellia bacterium]
MSPETSDLTRILFKALAGLLMLAGVTVDLCLAGRRVQTRRLTPSLRARAALVQRPFTAFHTQLTVFATLLFSLPTLFQNPAPALPKESEMIFGPLIYALTGLTIIALCLSYSRVSVSHAFFSPHCPTRQALKKGLLYGFAVLPPVALLAMALTAITDALGYEPQLQEVFGWIGDDSLTLGTRVFMMTAAVGIAPVVEEFLFRGILFTAVLKTRSFFFSALLSGTYFALVHFHAPSFLPLLALSFAFSAGYAATGSVLTPIVMHGLFNLASLVFYFADK